MIDYYVDRHIMPIEYRIKYKLCLLVYKILNNLAPQYSSNLFCIYKPLRENLRIGDDSFIITTTHHIEKTISHKMCQNWNLLPLSLRSCKNFDVFKKKLQTFYFKMYIWVEYLQQYNCSNISHWAVCMLNKKKFNIYRVFCH